MKSKIFKILIITIITIAVFSATVFAEYDGIDTDIQIGESDAANSSAEITARIVGILQVAGTVISVVTLIIIGMRYMFSSLEDRAKMKGVLVYWIIGCVLIFSTSNVLGFAYSVVDDIQHEYVKVPAAEGGIVRHPTCVSTGIQKIKCEICGKIAEVDIPINPDAHNMGSWEYTAETCIAEGRKIRNCKYGCGHYEQIIVPKLGHDFKTGTIKFPTCTETGYKGKKCKRIGCGFEKDITTIPATGHSATYKSEVTKAATCVDTGIKRYSCENSGCTHYYDETIPKTGHSATYKSEVTKAATCVNTGIKKYSCKNTGCTDSYTEVIPALGHSMDFTITKQPTCTAKGEKTYKCARCTHSYPREIAASGHNYTTVTLTATCTQAGGTYQICSVCGNKTGTVETPALGHSPGGWTQKTAATCTASKVEQRSCTRCGTVTETRNSGNALGHSAGSNVTRRNNNNNRTHTDMHSCTRCGIEMQGATYNCSMVYTGTDGWKYFHACVNHIFEFKCSWCGYVQWNSAKSGDRTWL